MTEKDLTPEKLVEVARGIERKLLMTESELPALTVPHILSQESSAYYHGYVLARMAVFQTREYFIQKYGYVVDNPMIGRDLTKGYWAAGNSKPFFQFVKDLTGNSFSADATARVVNRSPGRVALEASQAVSLEQMLPLYQRPVQLNATIVMVHGDETISSTQNGKSFEQMAKEYSDWVDKLKK